MDVRKVLLQALLHHAGGTVKGKTRMQKLAFLATEELKEEGIHPYDFIPYDYGPYSKAVYTALESLEDKGLVEKRTRRTYGGNKRTDYRLNRRGQEAYEDNLPESPETEGEERMDIVDGIAEEIVSEYNKMPLSNLLNRVYDEYPEYAQNSVLY